jgi:hypothetical protein
MLREQSLSDREMVLPSQEAKEALELLERATGLCWDGKDGEIPHGTHGFAPGGVLGEGRILIRWHEAPVCEAAQSQPARSLVF